MAPERSRMNLHDRIRTLRVIYRAGKEGLRSAYLTGFRIALDDGADAVAQMDADFSHDPAKLVEMASRLETCDLVIGSRYIPGGAVDEHWPLWRKSLSAFGNFYSRAILRLPQHDVTAGFRLWKTRNAGRNALATRSFQWLCLSGRDDISCALPRL